jgi:MFS family permease
MSPSEEPLHSTPQAFLGWRMVAIAFMCTNLLLGFTFGTYGTFVASISGEFPASRSLLSAGLALVVTIMGLLAPVVGHAIVRWSIRSVMTAGLAVLSLMFLLVSLATSAGQFVAIFGVLGGVSAACLVVVPPTTLVNNWFVEQRGKATGIVMIPLLVMAMPPVAAAAISSFGWRTTAVGLALIVLLLLPVMRLCIDRPADVGQHPLGAGTRPANAITAMAGVESAGASLIREPVFWAITFCAGVVSGAGVTITTHLVPYATGLGISLQSAAFLLAILGGAGMAGGVVFGLLADRVGGARALGLMSLIQAVLWPGLLVAGGYPVLALMVAGIGLCAAAILPVVATLYGNVFGARAFARVMAFYSLGAMPFGLLMPLLAGWLFDISGSYRTVFIVHGLLFACAVAILFYVSRVETARRFAPAPA